ncbi:MAG: hypothetical protein IJI96_06140 [Methanobrevibacter sp.]|nr:hypothetical protein [Methanobrevibacter sp.]MBQ6628316.1 hypothetical protein [Methanobrevibacter sp.]
MAVDLIGTIVTILVFAAIVGFCCSGESDSSSNTSQKNTPPRRQNTYHTPYDFCECPSCGAPGYDGYCEECGYPDINQGWLGENY